MFSVGDGMKPTEGGEGGLIIYYYNPVELTAMATAKIFMVRRGEICTMGSNIKLAWIDHVLHASLICIGNMFGVNPQSMNHAQLHTLTALSCPAQTVATEAKCSV